MATILNDWLIRRMMSGSITPPAYIQFVDPVVEAICASTWGDGIGLTYGQAASVTSLGTTFNGNTSIVSFDELQYFTGLTEITGSNNVSSSAFGNCTSLVSIVLPNNCTTIGNHAFDGCSSLTTVSLPSSLTACGGYSFQNCTSLTTVTYSGSGTFSVGEYAFRYCPLTVSFPTLAIASVADGYAFHRNKMSYIELNSTISYIGSRAFLRLGQADTTVVMRNTTPPTLGNGLVFYYDNGGGSFYKNTLLKIYVPYSADHSVLNTYKTTGNWTTYADYIFELDSNGNIPT